MKKLLIWLLIIVVVLLTAGYFARNAIVAGAITRGSSYALGVNVDLGSAYLALGAGSLELKEYKVHNPEGYDSDYLMSVNYGMLDLNSGSVFGDTLIVDSLILDGIALTLIQRDGKGNFMDIMEHTKNLNFDTSKSDTRVKIRKLVVKDISVDASLKFLNSVNVDKSFTVENITMNNVGGDDGATIGEVASIILREVSKRAVIKGKGQLSDQFGKGVEKLEDRVVEKTGADAVQKVKDIGGSILGGDKK